MKLIGRTGAVAGRDAIVGQALRIGAAADNDLRVEVTGISRHHARIVRQGDDYWLEDSGSTNGTFVNGLRVARERLRHLDVVTLGRSVDLIAIAAEQQEAAPMPSVQAIRAAWLEPMDAQSGARIDIPPGELTLGRSAPSNVLLDSPLVSHLHARLERTADHLVVSDLASSNGTFINGRLIREPMELVDGDLLSIAGSRQFRVSIQGSAHRDESVKLDTSHSQVFDSEWKTRLVWSADELVELEADRQRVLAAWKKQQAMAAAGGATPPAKSDRPAPPPAKPDAAGAKPPAPPVAKPPAAASSAKPPAPPPVAKPPVPPPVAKPPVVPPVAKPPVEPVVAKPPAPLADPGREPVPRVAVPPVMKKSTQQGPAAVRPPAPPPSSASRAPAPPSPPSRPAPSPPQARPSSASAQPAAARGPVRSVILKGLKEQQQTFRLGPGRHDVGRSEGISVTLLSPQVSRQHAAIIVTPTEVRVEDAKSANGTVINGARVPTGGTAVIKTGDRLAFGNMEFIVELVS